MRVTRTVPKTANPGNKNIPWGAMYPPPLGGALAAAMVRVEDDELDPGDIVAGLKVQVMPASAEQLSEI